MMQEKPVEESSQDAQQQRCGHGPLAELCMERLDLIYRVADLQDSHNFHFIRLLIVLSEYGDQDGYIWRFRVTVHFSNRFLKGAFLIDFLICSDKILIAQRMRRKRLILIHCVIDRNIKKECLLGIIGVGPDYTDIDQVLPPAVVDQFRLHFPVGFTVFAFPDDVFQLSIIEPGRGRNGDTFQVALINVIKRTEEPGVSQQQQDDTHRQHGCQYAQYDPEDQLSLYSVGYVYNRPVYCLTSGRSHMDVYLTFMDSVFLSQLCACYRV